MTTGAEDTASITESIAALSVSCHSSWPTPSSSVHEPSGRASDGSSSFDSPSASDSPHTGERFVVGRAQQVEPVALRLRRRVLVREHVAGSGRFEPERADDAEGLVPVAGLVVEAHAVQVQRRVVGREDAVGQPPAQRRRRVGVGIVAADGQVDAHDVVLVAVDQLLPLVRVDHVVGRRGHEREVVVRVPDARKRSEAGHVSILA